jgi:hypothetical protein
MSARQPTPERIAALDKKMGDWSVGCLSILGLWILLSPLVGAYTGYVWLTDRLGGESALLRVLVGFLFLYFAGIVREKNAMRETLRAFRRAAREVQKPSTDESRQAVDLLLAGLNSASSEVRDVARENLKRLTGQDFGDNHDHWESWWASNRSSFGSATK